jgi:hypothetical protein
MVSDRSPKRAWRFVAAAGLAAAIALGGYGISHGAEEHDRGSDPHPTKGSPAYRQPNCDTPKDYTEDVYCLNRKATDAAQAQATWAAWQVAIGLLGLVGLGFTVVYAKQAWKTAERGLVSIERAFVFLDGFTVELTTAADSKSVDPATLPPNYRDDPGLYITRLAIMPRWKNSGSTPTKRMSIKTNAGPSRYGLDPDGRQEPIFDYGRGSVAFTLGPGATETSNDLDLPNARTIIDHSFSPVGDPPLYLIWGRADYEDVFGKPHFVEWCYRLRLERHDGKNLRAHFIQWGNYNRTDDPED